jgi:biofilm PGA synthesis lipoprotein PgaB
MVKPKRFIRPLLVPVALLLTVTSMKHLGAEAKPGLRSLATGRVAPSPPAPEIAVLCYHDISDGPDEPSITISPALLRAQIRGMKQGGWTFLSVSELLAYKERPAELPPRVAVLTFDDGYRSFSEQALPILKEEGVKATLAIVSSFINDPPKDMPPLMSWNQVREADQSGLVEIASHSHDLHRYVTSNPYRDTGPSIITRRYLLEEARYEDREEYRSRIREDLRKSRRILRERLGHDVKVLAWPYGGHNAMARAVAAKEGFTATLGLDGVPVRTEDLQGGYIPRVMVYRGSRIKGKGLGWLYPPRIPVRAAQVDLDAVYDADRDLFVRRLDRVVEKVGRMVPIPMDPVSSGRPGSRTTRSPCARTSGRWRLTSSSARG